MTTPATPQARASGHLYSAIALAHRAKRCGRSWDEHLQTCHEVIQNSIRGRGGHLAILGSGLLLETPPVLFSQFSQISLLDIVHTKSVRSSVKQATNINLVECDLTGDFLCNIDQHFDFGISANLLSQLPLVPCEKMFKLGHTEDKILNHSYHIQQQHWLDMKKYFKHGLLFSDKEVSTLDQKGHCVEKYQSVDPRIGIDWQEEWEWSLAPAPEVYPDRSVQLTVGASSW